MDHGPLLFLGVAFALAVLYRYGPAVMGSLLIILLFDRGGDEVAISDEPA
jgi:hypothetical protein